MTDLCLIGCLYFQDVAESSEVPVEREILADTTGVDTTHE